MNMGIVVIGSVFVDVKGFPNNPFIPKGRNVGRIETTFGGVCRNVAENIANLELRPTFISLVDNSGTGQDVIDDLNKHKVNTKYIKKIDNGMGTWLAVFNHKGDVEAAISSRPDLLPILDVLNEHGDTIFKNCDSIVVEIDTDSKINNKVFEFAKKYKKKVYAIVSNISIAVQRRDLIRQVDCFVCNEQEASIFFTDEIDIKELIDNPNLLVEKVKNAGLNSMIITLGEHGSVYASKDGKSGHCKAIKTDVVDTTGAGDAFFSGVAAGLTYGKTLEEACKIGTKLSSSVLTTTKSVCPRFNPEEFNLK